LQQHNLAIWNLTYLNNYLFHTHYLSLFKLVLIFRSICIIKTTTIQQDNNLLNFLSGTCHQSKLFGSPRGTLRLAVTSKEQGGLLRETRKRTFTKRKLSQFPHLWGHSPKRIGSLLCLGWRSKLAAQFE
jgi:hypothetical protein